MFQKLKSGLGELDNVSWLVALGNEIYVVRYDPKFDSLFQTISNTIKADTNSISGQGDKSRYSTFPYGAKLNDISRSIDFDNSQTQDLLFKLHLYTDQVVANANLNHLTDWKLDHSLRYKK